MPRNSTARKKEAGQALIAAIAGLGIVLMGFAGLGIDVGVMRYEKRLQQTAADSAALAGAAELPYSTAYVEAAQHDAFVNGFKDASGNDLTPCTNNDPHSSANTGTVCVQVNSPPSAGPHQGISGYVEAYVAQVRPTFFMRVLGINSETVTTRAVATQSQSGASSGCLYTLDQNTGNAGLTIQVNTANINFSGCRIVSDSNLLLQATNGTITAGSIGVVNQSTHNCSDISPGGRNCSVTPPPVTGIVPAPDPLAYLTPPALGGCLPNPNVSGNTSNVTLNPGNYCNGISISTGAPVTTVTFNPGVYAIEAPASNPNGVGFSVGGNNVNLTGNGVTFYEYGGSINMGPGNLNTNLTAPTTGPLAGILFWQAASDTNMAYIGTTNSNAVLQGTFYMPGAELKMGTNSNVASYTFFVVGDLLIQTTTLNLNDDVSSLPLGSPIKSAVLVE